MIYKVVIEETICDCFEIEADSKDEALEKAEKMYRNEEIVLEPGELIDVKFSVE